MKIRNERNEKRRGSKRQRKKKGRENISLDQGEAFEVLDMGTTDANALILTLRAQLEIV